MKFSLQTRCKKVKLIKRGGWRRGGEEGILTEVYRIRYIYIHTRVSTISENEFRNISFESFVISMINRREIRFVREFFPRLREKKFTFRKAATSREGRRRS